MAYLLRRSAAFATRDQQDPNDNGINEVEVGDTQYLDDNDGGYNWYWSDEARAIKYGLLFGLLLLGFLVILGMWWHANRRIKKGLPPLPYHRWLVPRSQRAQFEPHLQQPEQNFSFYQHQTGGQYPMYPMYPMHPPQGPHHSMPPPAYNPNYAQPPIYSGGPPQGATKVNPSQDSSRPQDENQTQTQNPNGESSSSNIAVPPPAVVPAYIPYPQNNNPYYGHTYP